MRQYKLTCNYSRKTYTIRVYDAKGQLIAKYRSLPQGRDFSDIWTQNDIANFLKYSNDYYLVK